MVFIFCIIIVIGIIIIIGFNSNGRVIIWDILLERGFVALYISIFIYFAPVTRFSIITNINIQIVFYLANEFPSRSLACRTGYIADITT